jgi:uncharacterized damage-inducible protein DinB
VGDRPDSDEAASILGAADAILAQGEDLLRSLTDEVYRRKIPVAFDASIGGHYRHCLDHFTSLLRALGREEIDYDDRQRDARLELDRLFALEATTQFRAACRRLSPGALTRRVRARAQVDHSAARSPACHSTAGRELVYVIAHAVHHYALIAVLARLQGAALPPEFGVAPSTLAHLRRPRTASERS